MQRVLASSGMNSLAGSMTLSPARWRRRVAIRASGWSCNWLAQIVLPQTCEVGPHVHGEGKRLKVMIPALLPALERHGRLHLEAADRAKVLAVSAATIDRMLSATRVAAAGGKRRRAGYSSAIRREVPIRTFNDWKAPPPGFCEVDMVAHGGTSVAGSFIQTLTMVDIATGWTECLPRVTREGALVVDAIERSQSLFPWLLRGLDFDNDSAFMNDVVVPWCRAREIEVTRSRAYKKNDQAHVEQKNGAVVKKKPLPVVRGRPSTNVPTFDVAKSTVSNITTPRHCRPVASPRVDPWVNVRRQQEMSNFPVLPRYI
jgi:hypothetical protein